MSLLGFVLVVTLFYIFFHKNTRQWRRIIYLFTTEESENQNREFSITMIKNLVEYQKKALTEFGEAYLT